MKIPRNLLHPLVLAGVLMAALMFVGEVASAQTHGLHGAPVNIEVNARCAENRAIFEIHNAGKRWEGTGEIIVFAEEQRKIIARRQILFAKGQTARYRVPLSDSSISKEFSGAIRVFVTFGDASQKPIVDSRLHCKAL